VPLTRREETERAEQRRLAEVERARLAERSELEALRLEVARLRAAEATRLAAVAEAERAARERAEAERLAREKAEAARAVRERAEAERLAREEAERASLETAFRGAVERERRKAIRNGDIPTKDFGSVERNSTASAFERWHTYISIAAQLEPSAIARTVRETSQALAALARIAYGQSPHGPHTWRYSARGVVTFIGLPGDDALELREVKGIYGRTIQITSRDSKGRRKFPMQLLVQGVQGGSQETVEEAAEDFGARLSDEEPGRYAMIEWVRVSVTRLKTADERRAWRASR
jgi:multidrug efflux pump subunit AcrA (membrane-fusion protein)